MSAFRIESGRLVMSSGMARYDSSRLMNSCLAYCMTMETAVHGGKPEHSVSGTLHLCPTPSAR